MGPNVHRKIGDGVGVIGVFMQAELNGETRIVIRQRRGVIWCPFCDRSKQEEGLDMWCDGCNAHFIDEVEQPTEEAAAPAPKRGRPPRAMVRLVEEASQ